MLILALVTYSTAAVAQTVTIGRNDVQRAVWIGNANYTFNQSRTFQNTALLTLINTLYKADPSLPPEQAIHLVHQAQEAYTRNLTHGSDGGPVDLKDQTDAVNGMFDVLKTLPLPGMDTGVTIAHEAFNWYSKQQLASLAQDQQLLSDEQRFSAFVESGSYQTEQLSLAYDLTRANPYAAQVVNTVFGPQVNATTTDSTSQILAQNPGFEQDRSIHKIEQALAPDGSLTTSVTNLSTSVQQGFDELHDVIDDDRRLLKKIDAQQTSLLGYVSDANARQAAIQEAEQQRLLHTTQIQAVGSSTYILGTFLGILHSPLSGPVIALGRSGVQIANAISEYTTTASKLGSVGSSLGAVVLTGNVLGAAMSFASIFGPSTDQMILDELHEMRKELASLHEEMQQRFDRIDVSLNAIYTALNADFSRLDDAQQVLTGDVSSVQGDLLRLSNNLTQSQRSTHDYLADTSRYDLREVINGGVDYQEIYGQPIPLALFTTEENVLFSYAHNHAVSITEAGPLNRDLSDEAVLKELSSLPLEVNTNYLVAYLNNTNRFLSSSNKLPSTRLPNPTTWSIAAEAYVRFLQNNPISFPGRAQRIEAVLQPGENYKLVVKTISSKASGAVGYSLAKGAIENYSAKLSILDGQIQTVQQAQFMRMQNDLSARWLAPAVAYWSPCSDSATFFYKGNLSFGSDPNVAVPKVFAAIPEWVKRANVLTGAKVSLCYDTVEVRERTVERVNLPIYGPQCPVIMDRMSGVLRVHIVGNLGEKQFMSRSVQSAKELMNVTILTDPCGFTSGSTPLTLEANALVERHWTTGDKLADRVLTQAEETPNDALKALFGEVDKQMTDSERSTVLNEVRKRLQNADLYPALANVGGAAEILKAVLQLGFPTSLGRDDLLRSMVYGQNQLPGIQAIWKMYDDEIVSSGVAGRTPQLISFASSITPIIDGVSQHLQQVLSDEDKGLREEQCQDVERVVSDLRSLRSNRASSQIPYGR